MLGCVRRYAAHPLSWRNLEEIMIGRGAVVDHPTVQPVDDQERCRCLRLPSK